MSNVMNKLGITGDKWLRHRDTFSSIDWTENPQCTKDEWDIAQSQLKAEYDAQEYARNREEAYPSTGDQLDYIYHNGVAKWKTDMIDPVKTKYPKG